MFGLLNVNKPAGITSRDVVNHVQRIVRSDSAGHAGTLDPLARGVVVVCIGPATRLVEYVQRMPKQYTGTFLLGRQSDTEDILGTVVEQTDAPRPTREEIERTLPLFTGRIDQRPPVYSALKVGGKRAYRLAREGKHVELKPRKVNVYEIRIVAYEYPELVLDIACGGGTYVRSLGRDMAAKLGTAAVMSDLVRTSIGRFSVEEACDLNELTPQTIAARLMPALCAVDSLPVICLTEDEAGRIRHGMAIPNRLAVAGSEIAAQDGSGRLLAILVPRGERDLGPTRNFPPDP